MKVWTQIQMMIQVIDIPNSMTVLPELLPYSIEMVSLCVLHVTLRHVEDMLAANISPRLACPMSISACNLVLTCFA